LIFIFFQCVSRVCFCFAFSCYYKGKCSSHNFSLFSPPKWRKKIEKCKTRIEIEYGGINNFFMTSSSIALDFLLDLFLWSISKKNLLWVVFDLCVRNIEKKIDRLFLFLYSFRKEIFLAHWIILFKFVYIFLYSRIVSHSLRKRTQKKVDFGLVCGFFHSSVGKIFGLVCNFPLTPKNFPQRVKNMLNGARCNNNKKYYKICLLSVPSLKEIIMYEVKLEA
jgi:hypothetical protein